MNITKERFWDKVIQIFSFYHITSLCRQNVHILCFLYQEIWRQNILILRYYKVTISGDKTYTFCPIITLRILGTKNAHFVLFYTKKSGTKQAYFVYFYIRKVRDKSSGDTVYALCAIITSGILRTKHIYVVLILYQEFWRQKAYIFCGIIISSLMGKKIFDLLLPV